MGSCQLVDLSGTLALHSNCTINFTTLTAQKITRKISAPLIFFPNPHLGKQQLSKTPDRIDEFKSTCSSKQQLKGIFTPQTNICASRYSVGWFKLVLLFICIADMVDDLTRFTVLCALYNEWFKAEIQRICDWSTAWFTCTQRIFPVAQHDQMSLKLQMTDETWDKLVKRSHIIYSVIHFTIPCSDTQLPQSCCFKPSFPTRGCRLPSL